MSDIRRVADKIISMRDGRISGNFYEKPLDYEGAVTAMLGHRMTEIDVRIPKKGKPVLELSNLKLTENSDEINLKVSENEVIAITGLLGSGKTLLASVLFGIEKAFSGAIKLNGRKFNPLNPREAINNGVHMSPKDRSSNAIIQGFDIEKNLTLPFLSDYSLLSILQPSLIK